MPDTAKQDITVLVLEFADALNRRDAEAFGAVWSDKSTWAIDPPQGFSFTGSPSELGDVFRERIARWAGFVQLVHGTLARVSGDHATARSYLTEIGQPAEDEGGYANHGVYLDDLIRTEEGWRFTRRRYFYLYLDRSPLTGQIRTPPDWEPLA